ncbi:uncharacterized protein LOC128670038 isoform X2 [Plodia interpunctella]|uniref:uncharacterized protein LOC128670038 isoform X2 n=1 Tax=Plodia interpunctella TaxID=58824 RepID=UPI0023680C97|nr:uncharacterized protein LOC128670038 isoform X2 [Plodia interpunctella]
MLKAFNTVFLNYGICIILFSFIPGLQSESGTVDSDSENKALVEVRAVFINCQTNEGLASPDTEAARFQREELFKHNALKDCNTKLALSLKLASLPQGNSDEYIPIDHVIEGPSKRRVRLLNPYVLRLRWENPVQVYKLQNMDIVTGVFTEAEKRVAEKKHTKYKKDRVVRSANQVQGPSQSLGATSFFSTSHDNNDYVDPRQIADFVNYFNTSLLRKKRQQQNIVVEPQSSDEESWISDLEATDVHVRSRGTTAMVGAPHKHVTRENNFWKKAKSNFDKYFPQNEKVSHKHHTHAKKVLTENSGGSGEVYRDNGIETSNIDSDQQHFRDASNDLSKPAMDEMYSSENTFSLYDIGNPDIWCVVHVELFEKRSTPEGKTVWNDITKGETASVSPVTPEWRDRDLNIRYRSTEWMSQDQFTLPVTTSLCLLVPQTDSNDSELIIVPTEDVVFMDDDYIKLNKRDENSSQNLAADPLEKHHRKVMVRVARTLQRGLDNLNIVEQGSDHYLTLPHRRPHHIQIDVETRADDNQLIRVGADGRLTTTVSDNSRRTRTVFTVQATNTGLAAAKFKVKTRDCGPELSSLLQEKSGAGAETDFVLIPPYHTKRISLDLPVELPGEVAHCSIALVNQNDESVAIRDVTIRRGDRCYCVWHCDCVCLSEDPKLLCREMSEPRQVAAGLRRDRARRTRDICYPNCECLNVFVLIGGVLAVLFSLGFLKACLGLIIKPVGSLYLDKLVRLPRKMEQYHERSLRGRRVVYDADGWPIHPDTSKRTVRSLSRGTEFILNLIFFIAAPCMIVCGLVSQLVSKQKCTKRNDSNAKTRVSANFQEELPRLRLRRGRRLRKWMTPEADDLSTNLWRHGLLPQRSYNCKFMRPLLTEDECRAGGTPSSADSEQDDTEYVLTQMQKSRESLARTQMMNMTTSPSTK